MEKSMEVIKFLFRETGNLTIKDLQNLSDTLNVMKIKIRLDMLINAYDNNDETKLIREMVNEKIKEVKTRLDANSKIPVYVPIAKETLEKEVLKEIYASLISLRGDILNANNHIMNEKTTYYNDLMTDLINTNVKINQIDDDTLLNFFGGQVARKTPDNEEREFNLNSYVINQIFDILCNKRLYNGIIKNIPIKEQELAIKKEIKLYTIILKNKELLKEEVKALESVETIDTEIKTLEEAKGRINHSLVIDDIKKNNRRFRRTKIKTFPLEINLDDCIITITEVNALEIIAKIDDMIRNKKQEKLEFLINYAKDKDKLNNINQLMTDIINNNPNNKDIKELVNIQNKELENIIKELNNDLKSLPVYIGENDILNLINNHYESCQNIISLYLDSNQERMGCTPLISFYILKALCDCEVSNDIDYEKYETEETKFENNHLINEMNREYRQRLAELSNIDTIVEAKVINRYTKVRK